MNALLQSVYEQLIYAKLITFLYNCYTALRQKKTERKLIKLTVVDFDPNWM